MKRPTKKEVIRAIKRDFPGTKKLKYIEAVKLDSGIIVVEYETRSTANLTTRRGQTHVERRLIAIDPQGRFRNSFIVTSWFENKRGKKVWP